MKKEDKYIGVGFIFVILLCLLGLVYVVYATQAVPGQATIITSNTNFSPSLLFEHDGVKVYRFQDGGHYVYYTDARGSAVYPHTITTGKVASTTWKEVPTIK